MNYDRCLRYLEQLGEHKNKEWHCFSWYKPKSHHKKLAGGRVKAKENPFFKQHNVQVEYSFQWRIAEDKNLRGLKKQLNESICIVLVQKFISSKISESYHWESTLLSVPVGPRFYAFLGTSSSVLENPLGPCMCPSLLKIFLCTEWCVSAVLDTSFIPRVWGCAIIESQSGWVGRDLRCHPVPTSCHTVRHFVKTPVQYCPK